MIVTFVLVIATSASLIQGAPSNSSQCYSHEGYFYPYFSTRTAYESVHGQQVRSNSTCVPVQIWMLARHGARYPDEDVLVKMMEVIQLKSRIIESYERGAGLLCNAEVDELRSWQLNPNFKIESAELLTAQGEENLRLLARRLRNDFPELLQAEIFKPTDYIFRATNTQRTQGSLRAFAHGLFDIKNYSHIVPSANEQNDTLLLAHKSCPSWQKSYVEEHVNAESDKFTKGPEVKAVLDNISTRFGFAVDFATVKNMYDMCRYETSWHLKQPSTWCRLFTTEELKVMEYREDLDLYYYAGPGRDINVKLGCRTLSDMFDHFEKLVVQNFVGQPRGVFYFAHTVTLQALMSVLQINEDKPLLASGYANSHNRTFRTSLLGPFGTNIVAIFYNCSDNTMTSHKISFHVAEKLVNLPGCRNGLCDWDYLKQKFDLDVKQCSSDFCSEPKEVKGNINNVSSRHHLELFILTVTALIVAYETGILYT